MDMACRRFRETLNYVSMLEQSRRKPKTATFDHRK